MVVAAGAGELAALEHRGAPELGTPHDQGLVEQAAHLEIRDQRGDRLVGLLHFFLRFFSMPLWWSHDEL